MTRILHLSDLHFGAGHHFPQGDASPGSRSTLAGAIVSALERDGSTEVDHLVLSGDLLDHDQPADQAHARDGIRQLTAGLGIDPGRVLCVPGNHDLTWNPQWREHKFRFYDELLEATGAVGLTGDMPNVISSPGEGGRPGLAFVLLNSCRIEDELLAGLGEVGATQLEDVRHRLGDLGITPHTHTIVAVMHHHLLPIVAREESLYDEHGHPATKKVPRPSLVVDAVRTLHCFAEVGVSMVLHGHQHQPAVLRYEDVLHGTLPIGILAAGSCGASGENMRRHFFVIDIEEDRAVIRSFEQIGHDPDRFAPVSQEAVRLTLSHVRSAWHSESAQAMGDGNGGGPMPLAMLNGYCTADLEGRTVNPQVEPVEKDEEGDYLTEDNSDLYVMMLSVSDCPTAREKLRDAIGALGQERFWERLGEPRVSLLGMYDLLGNWDLAVRLRIGNGASPSRIGNYLDKRLQEGGLRRSKGLFSEKSMLDVSREAGSIQAVQTPGTAPIERRMLGGTADYDRLRCQRSFVWIELGAGREKILDELVEAFEQEPEVSAIVESASLNDQVLLLETFSACGQSSEIARLNRLIEPILARWGRQKYTLTCYGYDEEPLVVTGRAPV